MERCFQLFLLSLAFFTAAPAASQTTHAPDFTLKTLSHDSVTLSQFRGHPVLLNFWASWCKPCREELPGIMAAYEAHHATGLEVLAINLTDQERMQDVRRFAAELRMPFPVPLDEKGKVRKRYALVSVPTSVFIDAVGVERVVHSGPMTSDAIQRGLAAILPR